MTTNFDAMGPETLLAHDAFVRRISRGLIRDEHLAEDVAQDTWLSWLRNPPSGTAGPGWFRTAARHRAISTARKRRSSVEREIDEARSEALPSVAEDLEQASAMCSVTEAVLQLEEPYRSAILMRYFRGWSAAKIARETDTPLATIRSRIHRAKGQLREVLDAEFGGRERWSMLLAERAISGAGVRLVAPTAAKVAALVLGLVGGGAAAFELLGEDDPSSATPVAVVSALAVADVRELADVERSGVRDVRRELVSGSAGADAAPSGALQLSGRVTLAPFGLEGGPAADLLLTATIVRDALEGSAPVQGAAGLDAVARGAADLGAELGPGSLSFRTDGDGRFHVGLAGIGVRPRRLRLTSERAPGYRALSQLIDFSANERAGEGLELELFAAARLTGEVVHEGGRPLAQAPLELRLWSAAAPASSQPASATLLASPAPLPGRPAASARAVTDAQGRFQVELQHEASRVDVVLPGYAILSCTGGERESRGSWTPLQVVVTDAGQLEVELHEASGGPSVGTAVVVALHPSERAVLDKIGGVPEIVALTDASGLARFEGVWMRRQLVVTARQVEGEQRCQIRAAVCLGETLIPGEQRGSGRPIVVDVGGRRRFQLTWPPELVVTGTVFGPGGEPARCATVRVDDAGYERRVVKIDQVRTRPDGTFELRAMAPDLRGPLRITAAEGGRMHRDSASRKSGLGKLQALQLVALPRAQRGRIAVELPLTLQHDGAAGLELAGQLLDPAGAAAQGRAYGVWLLAGASEAGSRRLDAPTRVKIGADGWFRVEGLVPGSYTLRVTGGASARYGFPTFMHDFTDLVAGDDRLELRLPEPDVVRVRVRAVGVDVEPVSLFRGRCLPRAHVTPAGRAADPLIRTDSIENWPEQIALGAVGTTGGVSADGGLKFESWTQTLSGTYELPAQSSGWCSFGVAPLPGSDPQFAPVATELLYFGPGEYEIVFNLRPIGTLEVQLNGLRSKVALVAMLVDPESGASVPLRRQRGAGALSSTLPINARGRFVLRQVPVGTYLLRIGMRSELLDGQARFERELVLVEGHNPRLELDVVSLSEPGVALRPQLGAERR